MLYDSSVSKMQENGRTISLFSLSVPSFFEQIFRMMLSTVNTLMLSGYSQEAVAATSVSAQLENVMLYLVTIIIFGMSIVISIELGRKNRKAAAQVAGAAVISALVFSLALGITASAFSEQLVSIMKLEGETMVLSSGFFKIKSATLFLTLLLSVFNNLLICNGYAACSFLVGILSNVLNVGFGYLVLYSGLNLPIQGVNGIAVASVFARIISLFVAVYLYRKKKCPFSFTFHTKTFLKMFRLGLPRGLGMLSWVATQVITTGFMASFGVVVLNAKVYISNIIQYTTAVTASVSIANGVLMGRYRGQGAFDKMRILHRQNLMITVLSSFTLSALAFVLYKPLISLFSNDSQILSLAASIMAIDIIVEIARAINVMSERSLNANGDVIPTLVVPLFTCWVFGVLLAYILGVTCALGLIGCWIGFAMDEAVKAVLYSFRWYRGKWKNTKV